MTRLKVKELIWDSWNIEHIKKHTVTKNEAEIVALNFDYHKKAHSGRYLLVGKKKDRILSVIVDRKKANTYYVVSARDANKKERKNLNERNQK